MRASVSPLSAVVSHEHVTELVAERGVEVDASCIWRWVRAYAAELSKAEGAIPPGGFTPVQVSQ